LTVTTPYGLVESIYWLVKNVTGPSKTNAGIVGNIPNSYILNKNIKSKYKLTFIGDIMPTAESLVDFTDELKEFLSDSDYLIANFEGTITEWRKDALILISDRRHNRKIMEILTSLFPPEKTYLSVSNNHAGDFGKREFFKSVKMLESRNFNVFGWNERPYFDINDKIRIISGTMWSNRSCDYVFRLENAKDNIKPGAFNFLYPHFGYEFELYPRPQIVEMVKSMIQEFDAIIGHHTHCPQPVSAESVKGTNRLLGYSLGDFISVRRAKNYQYGIIAKVELGYNEGGEWLLGRVEWRLTKCSFLSNSDFIVSLSSKPILGEF
ncbi:MAG: CapA family protein, partial [Candidatus Omnitrophota bacterium]